MKQKSFYLRLAIFILFFAGGLCAIIWGVGALSTPLHTGNVSYESLERAALAAGNGQAPAAAAEAPAKPEPSAKPEAPADWRLTLVNRETPLRGAPQPDLETLYGSHQVDERILADLQLLLSACEKAGYTPMVCSAYRTEEEQTALFERKAQAYLDEGTPKDQAESLADRAVARPGTSEHQLGLAVDIVSEDNQRLDDTQGENPAQVWLMENAWQYGFILRYPADKEDATMKMYEPWHYRYVGREHARAIKESGLCLEEFLEK